MSKIDFNNAFLNGFGKDDRRPKAKKIENNAASRRSLKTGFSGDYSFLSGPQKKIIEDILNITLGN